jgi:hypothetical protein
VKHGIQRKNAGVSKDAGIPPVKQILLQGLYIAVIAEPAYIITED